MDSNVTEERQHAHALLDILPPEKVNAVVSLLEELVPQSGVSLADRLSKVTTEDEEITAEMAARLDRARVSADRGVCIPHEEMLREFGLDG